MRARLPDRMGRGVLFGSTEWPPNRGVIKPQARVGCACPDIRGIRRGVQFRLAPVGRRLDNARVVQKSLSLWMPQDGREGCLGLQKAPGRSGPIMAHHALGSIAPTEA